MLDGRPGSQRECEFLPVGETRRDAARTHEHPVGMSPHG